MDKQELYTLLDRFLKGETTPEEDFLLKEWYESKLGEAKTWTLENPDEKLQLRNAMLGRLKSELADEKKKAPVLSLSRWVAAASIILLVIAGWYLYNLPTGGANKTVNNQVADVLPGSARATLTLADGSVIILDDAVNGIIAAQGQANVTKLSDGELSYVDGNNGSANSMYNTMATPRGGQYQLRLPDGSKVWLNSSSSITFPAVFGEKDRQVTITGEAYFEIAKNSKKPFAVKFNDMLVEVLGTSFNVNAYSDEPEIHTTLLDGSVKVSKGSYNTILSPGQQAKVIEGKNQTIKVDKVNTDQVIAWKNGSFNFEDTDLKTVLRQLSRWYDVTVEYRGKVPDMDFGGEIGRSLNLSQVLEILEKSGVHFKIEGKKLIVLSE